MADQHFEYDVFISHVNADKAAARELAQLTPADDLQSQTNLVRMPSRLPVGWTRLEVFGPTSDADTWDVHDAKSQAQNDLTNQVLRSNLALKELSAIDTRRVARREFLALIYQVKSLLQQDAEEPIHQFLKQHPVLLCPTHTKMWSKLPLGRHVTDFVFQLPQSSYLFVELERPNCPLFRADGQQTAELTHAENQILDWLRYLEDNLKTVQDELGLSALTTTPDCLVVMGRRSTLTEAAHRKIQVKRDRQNIKIWTYDDLLEQADLVCDQFFGAQHVVGSGNAEVYVFPAASD